MLAEIYSLNKMVISIDETSISLSTLKYRRWTKKSKKFLNLDVTEPKNYTLWAAIN